MTTRSAARHTAAWTLIGIGLALVGIVVLVAATILAHGRAAPRTARQPSPPVRTSPHWNVDAEDALASRHMLTLPPQAAQPQPLSARNAGSPIVLPRARIPDAPTGALAQLRALDERGMADGDPDTYAHAYRDMAMAGAPDPRTTGLFAVLTNFRASGGLPGTGPVADLAVSYDVTEGLIKGSTDHGRYAVVCVLGELTVQYQAQTVSAGVGDCQALRWTGVDWRISPGALAAPAPCAWPGSADSVAAGYRELS